MFSCLCNQCILFQVIPSANDKDRHPREKHLGSRWHWYNVAADLEPDLSIVHEAAPGPDLENVLDHVLALYHWPGCGAVVSTVLVAIARTNWER